MMELVRLVAHKLARRLPRLIEVDDLLGAGAVGLAASMQRRGTMSGREFESFAEVRIRGAMLDELRKLDDLPRGMRRWATRIARARRSVEARTAEPASAADIASELGVAEEDYCAAQARIDASSVKVRLTTTDAEDRVAATDVDAVSADERLIRAQQLRMLGVTMAQLPERDRIVLVGIYAEERTLKDLAGVMGVCESRVSQIHVAAIARLRETMREDRTSNGRPSMAAPRRSSRPSDWEASK
jgi:RNA polymerase sigma factor for flagellar operon FliA